MVQPGDDVAVVARRQQQLPNEIDAPPIPWSLFFKIAAVTFIVLIILEAALIGLIRRGGGSLYYPIFDS